MKTFASFGVALVTLTLMLAGCGDSDSDGTPAATTTPGVAGSPQPADAATYFFDIEELGLGPGGYVALRNYTDVAGTLGGLFLCQPPRCFHLPDVEVAAGELAVVAISEDSDLDDVVATWPDLALTPSDGEIALYASEDVNDPGEIRDYLQWGSTPHEGTATAVDAGLWQETGFAPSSEKATRIFHDEGGWWKFDE